MTDKINDITASNSSFSLKIGNWIDFFTTWVIGAIFLYSGIQKIFLPYDFLGLIYGYEMVSPLCGVLLAKFLPWVEVVLAAFLFSKCLPTATWFLVTSLLVLFVVARLWVLYLGLVIPCGCYGIGEDIVNWQNTTYTSILAVIAFISFYRHSLNRCDNNQS